MKEIIQQKFWVHTRGVEVLLPPHASPAEAGNDPTESERLRQVINDGTLRRRYPTPTHGNKYMESVCYEKRNELLELSEEASGYIAESWKMINPNKPITIVLFGSVAKGLTKHARHPDPSNIDLAVIGDFTPEEQEELYDQIRPYREQVQDKILNRTQVTNSSNENGEKLGNLGVSIQHLDKLSNGHYSGITTYLGSGAFPLYDPSEIWREIESEALDKLSNDFKTKKKKQIYKPIREWDKMIKDKQFKSKNEEEQPRLLPHGDIYIQTPLL